MERHKHADLIIAWGMGETIQYFDDDHWYEVREPAWLPDTKYRVKPKDPNPHFTFIKAFAEGKKIERFNSKLQIWEVKDNPDWYESDEYRIKTEWYEEIPEKGILCWVSDNDVKLKRHFDIIYSFDLDLTYPFKGHVHNWIFAEPFTEEEMPTSL
jgi:hypothetical protein